MRFELWSSLNNIPAIVEYVSERTNFLLASDQMISIRSYAPVPAENPTTELFDRLKDLKTRYSKTWIPSTTAPKETAFQDAKRFVLSLPLMQIVRPSINVAGDGEVNFEWKGQDFQIDLGFYGNQTFSYYATKNGQKPLFGDDIPIKHGIPKELVDFASVV
jgi:hypothetical protein